MGVWRLIAVEAKINFPESFCAEFHRGYTTLYEEEPQRRCVSYTLTRSLPAPGACMESQISNHESAADNAVTHAPSDCCIRQRVAGDTLTVYPESLCQYTSCATKTRHVLARYRPCVGIRVISTSMYTMVMVESSVVRLVSHQLFVEHLMCPTVVKLVLTT